MIYIYTLLGITAWIGMVTFSTSALISHESGKQLQKAIQHTEESVSSLGKTREVQVSVPDTIPTTTEVVTPSFKEETLVTKPAATPKPIINIKQNNRDEEEDDEDD